MLKDGVYWVNMINEVNLELSFWIGLIIFGKQENVRFADLDQYIV